MNPLEERIEQLERKIERMESIIEGKQMGSSHGESHHGKRHRRHHTHSPEEAIRRAQKENALYLKHGIRVLGATIGLCLLFWGGVQLFEMADDFFKHEGNALHQPVVNKPARP